MRKTLTALVSTAAVVAGFLVFAPVADAAGLNVGNFSQCLNGAGSATNCVPGWSNGAINAVNSHYGEDNVVPQRLLLTATDTNTHTITFDYDVTKNGIHAYDSLATWNITQNTADPCQGIGAALCAGVPSTFPMASDPTPVPPAGPGISPVTSAHELPAASRNWTLYGGTITGVTTITNDGVSANAGITFTANAAGTQMVLLFGGHLSVSGAATIPRAWGPGVGATNVSGGPYHISLGKADGGSAGNQSNGIQAGGLIQGAPNFSISKTANPTSATPGQTVTYKITVTNNGNGPGDATFTDNFDDRLNPTIPTSSPTGGTCTREPSGTDRYFTCATIQLVGGGGQQTFTYTAVMPSTFTTGGGTGGCTDANAFPVANTATLATGGSSTATVCVAGAATFTITKTVDPTTANPGDPVTYTVTITNTGTAPGSTSFTDDYDDRLTITAPVGCTLATVSGNKVMNCTTNTISPGLNQQFQYSTTVPTTFSGDPGTGCQPGQFAITNTATLTGVQVGPGATVCVNATPAFTITKTATPGVAKPGDSISYKIIVTNGGAAAGSTTFVDDFDDRVTIANPPAGCTAGLVGTNKVLNCTTGIIAGGGGTQEFDYSGTLPSSFSGAPGSGCAPGQYAVTNTATLANQTADPATVCVTAAPQFGVQKTASTTSATPGQPITYTVRVTNSGNADGSTTFTDDYDDRLTITPPAGCTLATVGTNNVLKCTTSDILAGGHQDFVYTAAMPSSFTGPDGLGGCGAGQYPVANSVVVTDGGANSAVTVCVTAAPIFGITKTAKPTVAGPGDPVTYTITVSNTGTAAGATSFIDALDSRVKLPATVTIDPSGTASCNPSGTTLACQTDTILSGGQQTFSYTVTMPATFAGTPGGPSCSTSQYPVTNTATLNGGANSPSDSATVCVNAAPSFTITKTADPTDANPGQLVNYTVTVHNGGTASGSTTFTDDYDNRLTPTAVTTNPAGNGCTPATVAGNKVLNCTTGTINAGADQVFTYSANMPASFNPLTSPTTGCTSGKFSVRNTATLANQLSDTATVCVNAKATFTISKSVDHKTVNAGDPVMYTITVTNGGTLDGSTTFVDDYDDRLSVTPPAGCTLGTIGTNAVMNCTTGTIAALGGTQVFTYTVNMPATFTGNPGGGDCSSSAPQQYAVINSATLANNLSDSATVCVNAAPQFTVDKSVRPSSGVHAGDTVTYTITVHNTGTAAGSTTFTDNYDDRLTPTAVAGCTPGVNGVDKVLNCTTGIINAGDQQQFVYSATVPASFTGPSGSDTCATGTFPIDNAVTLANGKTAGSEVCVIAAPAFTIDKSATPVAASTGGTVTYVVTVTNNGTASGSTTFTDDYDDRLTPTTVTTDPAAGGCTADTVSGNAVLHCTTATIDAGHSQTFTYSATMPDSFTGPSGGDHCASGSYPVTNTATLTAVSTGNKGATVCVTAAPDFTISKSADPSTALPGQKVNYTVRVTNTGTAPGATSFTDNFDSRLQPTVPAGCTLSGNTLQCTTDSIDPGKYQEFTYSATMPSSFDGSPGTGCGTGQYAVHNTATLAGHETGTGATVCVNAAPAFTITKTATPTTGVKAGDPVTYKITVHNGGTASGSTSFQDDYDDRLTPGAVTIGQQGGSCSADTVGGNKVLDCSTGSILAGDDETFTYTVTMPASFTGIPGGQGCTASNPQQYPVSNSATLTNGPSDAVTVCVNAAPNFTITKVANPTTTNAGGAVQYTVTVRNTGTASGTTAFTDNYDDRLTLSSVTSNPAGASCVNTTTGDKSLTCNTGTINAGSQQTFTYSANMPASFSGIAGGAGCSATNPQQYPVTNSAQLTNGANSAATVCVNAAPVAQLTKSVVKTVNTDGSDQLVYTITYKNTGAADSASTVISDTIPANTVFDSCGGGCTAIGSPVTAVTWNVGPVTALGGTGTVTLTVHVTATAVCQISNTAYIQFDANSPVASNAAIITIDPLPNPAGAHASGNAIGVQVKTSGIVGINLGPIGQVSTVRNGLGPVQTANKSLLGISLPANGSLVRIPVVNETSASGVEANPAFAQDVTSAAVDHVCLLPIANVCTVQADTVQAVASTLATGAWSTYSSGGSTIQNLKILGLPTVVDLNATLKINLNPLVFGAGSYVAINERNGSAGLVGSTYVADEQVTMIHLVVTGLLTLQAANVIVSQATSHADFPQTLVCGNVAHQSVSGHAFVAQLRNAPTIADTTLGYVAIPATGANETQQIVGVNVPLGILAAAAGASQSFSNLSPTQSYSESNAEIAGDNGTRACVVRLSATSCLITANLVHSQSQSLATASGAKSTDSGTSLLNVSVAGIPIGLTVPPNTAIIIPGMGYVVLNEQMCDGGGLTYTHQCTGTHHSGLTVRAVDLVFTFLGSGLGVVPATQLIIGEAHSDATFGA